jgi:hypothetical protein
MDAKILTEEGWAEITKKFKEVKDNGLQKALFFYWTLDEDDFDFRLKAIGKVAALAGALKTAKEVKVLPEVVKYLTNLVNAAKAEEGAIKKAAALAEKTAKAEAIAKDKEKAEGEEEKEDPVVEQYQKILNTNIARAKNNTGVSFEYIVCVGDSGYNVMVAPAITAQHKAVLSKISNSRKFLPPGGEPGTCRFENNGFTFDVPKAVLGLAKGLQVSILQYTKKKYKIKVGLESEEGDEPEEGGAK